MAYQKLQEESLRKRRYEAVPRSFSAAKTRQKKNDDIFGNAPWRPAKTGARKAAKVCAVGRHVFIFVYRLCQSPKGGGHVSPNFPTTGPVDLLIVYSPIQPPNKYHSRRWWRLTPPMTRRRPRPCTTTSRSSRR